VAPGPDSAPELERQHAEIEAAFRRGWRPIGARKPRVLTEHAYAQARKILDHGGWAGLDQATFQAIRDGANPGDQLPPLQPHPYIDHVTDADVIITGNGPERQVAVLFSHEDFPGVRFGHRFLPDFDGHGSDLDLIELKETIETGALDRMMHDQPAADEIGVIWTTWDDPD